MSLYDTLSYDAHGKSLLLEIKISSRNALAAYSKLFLSQQQKKKKKETN